MTYNSAGKIARYIVHITHWTKHIHTLPARNFQDQSEFRKQKEFRQKERRGHRKKTPKDPERAKWRPILALVLYLTSHEKPKQFNCPHTITKTIEN